MQGSLQGSFQGFEVKEMTQNETEGEWKQLLSMLFVEQKQFQKILKFRLKFFFLMHKEHNVTGTL